MHRADKAVLRLAIGVGLAIWIAYGFSLQLPFVIPVLTILALLKPGPPMPFVKGAVVGLVVAGVLVAGVLMVPLLEHYAAAGVLATAAILFALFFFLARSGSPMGTILVIAFTVMPVAGVLEQALITALAKAFGIGLAIGALVNGFSHALFPDAPGPAAAAPPPGMGPDAARWQALQATVVIMPVFVVALSNPALYLMAIMKSVMLGQQAGVTAARSAGRELVGSTLMGAGLGAVVWGLLTLRPNLWMLALWCTAAALWTGARIFRVRPTSFAPSFWVNALVTMFIVLGPGIEDAQAGKDVYAASATRVVVLLAASVYAWAVVWMLDRWRLTRGRTPGRTRGTSPG